MSAHLHTAADLAERLGHSADYWQRQARKQQVPHRRIGRSIRFTDEDVAAIVAAALVPAHDPLASLTAGSRARSGRTPR